jgi:hypothetical protein
VAAVAAVAALLALPFYGSGCALLGSGSGEATPNAGPREGTAEASIAALSAAPFVPPEVGRDEAAWKALARYCPDAAAMVAWMIANGGTVTATTVTVGADGKAVEATRTSEPFFVWIDPTAPLRKQLLEGLSVAVHEENHGFSSAFPGYLLKSGEVDSGARYVLNGKGERIWTNFEAYYLDRDTRFFAVNRSANPNDMSYASFPAFPAREAAYLVPEAARTHRYPVYMSTPDLASYITTQTSGISGLLDEYNSYRWSVQVAYDLFAYVQGEEPDVARAWHEWMEATVRVYQSWAEFRLYIAAYLRHANEAEPAVFESLMADRSLRAAFTGIDDRFCRLITELFRRWTVELPEALAARGIPFRIYRAGSEAYWEIKEPSSAPQREWRTLFNTLRLQEFTTLERTLREPGFSEFLDRFRLHPVEPWVVSEPESFGTR